MPLQLKNYFVNHNKAYLFSKSNRGADRHRGPCKQTQFDCAVHGVRSSSLFRRKRRGKVLDVVSTAIPGGAAAWNK